MAVSNKYARRRRNAVLAAVAMALIFIIIIVVIVTSLAGKGNKKDPDSVTPTPTNTFGFPTLPTPTLNTDNQTGSTVTPTPDLTAGTVMYVTGSTVNVRAEASTDSDKIASLSKGTSVTAYTQTNGFYEVKLSDGKKGYISAKYLSVDNPSAPTASTEPTATPDTSNGTTMYVTGSTVNVRKSNTTSSNAVASVKKGNTVTAYTAVGDWTYIKTADGKYGYILSKYLSKDQPAVETPGPSASATNTTSATPTMPTLIPTNSPTTTPGTTDNANALTSFTQLSDLEPAIANALDSSSYKSMISMFNGLSYSGENYNGGSSASFYEYKSSDNNIKVYIVYSGTKEAPTDVKIQTDRP